MSPTSLLTGAWENSRWENGQRVEHEVWRRVQAQA